MMHEFSGGKIALVFGMSLRAERSDSQSFGDCHGLAASQ